uniref:Putative secreted protein n=1 Tax=Ixodes ricinus TaxID=34613 RepID=A0A6B0UJU9_IXORI
MRARRPATLLATVSNDGTSLTLAPALGDGAAFVSGPFSGAASTEPDASSFFSASGSFFSSAVGVAWALRCRDDFLEELRRVRPFFFPCLADFLVADGTTSGVSWYSSRPWR